MTWARFAKEMMKRFGGNGALNEYEAFAAVRHTGSLAEFVAAFEARLAQVPDISCQQYLGFFMAALQPEVRLQMKAAKITTYEDAVELALDIDRMTSSQPPRVAPNSPPSQSYSYTPHSARPFSKGNSQPPSHSSASSKPMSKRFRNVTPEEYRRHIAAGTCVKCGLKFGPAHRCPPRTLNVMICDEEEEASDDSDHEGERPDVEGEPQLSALSLNGLDTSNTMKLWGKIASQQVKVMVDSGANYCFISERCAHRLQLTITATSPYSVVLGDGSTRRTSGICNGVPLVMEDEEFRVSCYVFPLRNIDLILGVSWLASLGNVMANWQRSTMDFAVDGRPISLKGDPTVNPPFSLPATGSWPLGSLGLFGSTRASVRQLIDCSCLSRHGSTRCSTFRSSNVPLGTSQLKHHFRPTSSTLILPASPTRCWNDGLYRGMIKQSTKSSLNGLGWGMMKPLGWMWRTFEVSFRFSALRTRLFRPPGQLIRAAGRCTNAEEAGNRLRRRALETRRWLRLAFKNPLTREAVERAASRPYFYAF